MRRSLRRSCAACARSRHSCDRRTPSCSGCTRRGTECTYVNEPLSGDRTIASAEAPITVADIVLPYDRFVAVDPFNSYPPTRLSKSHVQRLMYVFLHKLALQYYPLDLRTSPNPFINLWWPLALSDPALFHLSLQTACLDEELFSRNSLYTSESSEIGFLVLLRRMSGEVTLAVKEGTMNYVIALAAIEFGKGHIQTSQMHVDSVENLVNFRGGIGSVKETSPLTAELVGWMSTVVTGKPWFDDQDEFDFGHGTPTMPTWQIRWDTPTADLTGLGIDEFDMDIDVRNVFVHLRNMFRQDQQEPLPPTRLHNVTCYAIHRLLRSTSGEPWSKRSIVNEQIRYATALYLFVLQSPTYFPQVAMMSQVGTRLRKHLEQSEQHLTKPRSLDVWSLLVGMIASTESNSRQWFSSKLRAKADYLQLSNWNDAFFRVKQVLWLDKPNAEAVFNVNWNTSVGSTGELHGFEPHNTLSESNFDLDYFSQNDPSGTIDRANYDEILDYFV